MAKNDLVLLDGILEEYQHQGIPSSKSDEVFEFFVTSQVLKNFAFSQNELLSGSVDGRNDGGIDEFFVLVNGHLAETIPNDFWPKSNSELEVFIITCKHDDSFKQSPITTLIPSLIELFDFSKSSLSLTNSYNQKLLEKRDLFYTAYKRTATSLSKFNINLVYACRGDEIVEDNIQSKATQAETICKDFFSGCSVSFSFWGNSRLLSSYRERPTSSLNLIFEDCINQNGQYVVLSSIKDFYNFISDPQGNLNRYLFDSNVRDYLGLNPVNSDILDSLKKQRGDAPNFWWLNNGITLIGSNAHIIGKSISIENAQIVNGMQTSFSIHKYMSESTPGDENRSVLIKILLLNDSVLRNEIIYATNNQTNVSVSSLHATDIIQRDIEELLLQHGIYYERRTNYFQNQGIPESEVVTPLALASGYIALLYKNPFAASVLKQKFMRDPIKYGKIFSNSHDINVWYPIAQLSLLTGKYLNYLRPKISENNQTKFLKHSRHIVMFHTISRLLGTYAFDEKQLINFDMAQYTHEEVQKTLLDLREMDENIFSKNQKISSSLYKKSFKYMSQKYNIIALSVIDKKSNLFWPQGTNPQHIILSEEVIETVYKELPAQPWPMSIHKTIAAKIGQSELMVSNVISYLIYTGKVNAQIFGYVFDKNNHIIAEGEHFGHTEAEARERLDRRSKTYKKLFGSKE